MRFACNKCWSSQKKESEKKKEESEKKTFSCHSKDQEGWREEFFPFSSLSLSKKKKVLEFQRERRMKGINKTKKEGERKKGEKKLRD